MDIPPRELIELLLGGDQGFLLQVWSNLSSGYRKELVAQIKQLDLELLAKLYADRESTYALPAPHLIAPLAGVLPEGADEEAKKLGAKALENAEVAVLVVAGGQGTRLGFDHPKGLYQVGPISGKSLFQLHAEKVLARSRRHGPTIPFLVMTSDATHAETVEYFEQQDHFGLPSDQVVFFKQGTMPALDLKTGRVLLDRPHRIFAGPDGHGGTLTALAGTGLLEQLAARGYKHVFYFQVDNPLVQIADPQFLGQHIRARAEVSSKVIHKDGPADKLGNFALIDGKLGMIEYSDLPKELAEAKEADGQLRIRVGNPAIHIFDVDFLTRVTAGEASGLPFHLARKKVPYWDHDTGEMVQPETENALKFERFIFDVLPLAERHCEVFTSRRDEFAPLKNASGADSPESVRKALSDLAASWLTAAGAKVSGAVELSPLTALEPEDLTGKYAGQTVSGVV